MSTDEAVYNAGVIAGLQLAKSLLGTCTCYPGYAEHEMVDPACLHCTYGKMFETEIGKFANGNMVIPNEPNS